MDTDARHGPCLEWTRREGGRLRHNVVSSDQAGLLAIGIDNYREILRLLRLWETKTAEEVIEAQERKPRIANNFRVWKSPRYQLTDVRKVSHELLSVRQ